VTTFPNIAVSFQSNVSDSEGFAACDA